VLVQCHSRENGKSKGQEAWKSTKDDEIQSKKNTMLKRILAKYFRNMRWIFETWRLINLAIKINEKVSFIIATIIFLRHSQCNAASQLKILYDGGKEK